MFKKFFGLTLLLAAVAAFSLSAKHPEGEGWKAEKITPSVTYYTFDGIDDITGVHQQVFVIDQDLSDPRYAFRFSYSQEDVPTSDVFLRNRAVAAMNAGYEASSIVIKVNCALRSCMPFNTVFKFPVPNWKSEGAVYTDGMQGVRISFDGKGKSIEEQRAFYGASEEPNILTSAPMLIDNFEPVGTTFVDPSIDPEDYKNYHYEDPVRHQGVRHPRTAVAKTADNHVILLAVDGRRKGISEGMSARELTLFLVKHFDPQYALNMDGGGSTTMCVRGFGDPVTHVVNYPNDNKKYDHAGERLRDTHFYIVEVDPPMPAPSKVRDGVREEVRADRNKASGLEGVYDMTHKAQTPAPKGYEPVYVSHYGRHGSRYAYTDKAYLVPLEILRNGAGSGNLTPRGYKLLQDLEAFWEQGQYKVGDLTPLGWDQHEWIAADMVKSFPQAFGKGSKVDAASSGAQRSIVSMAAFCASLSRVAPKADVYAHQGVLDIQATRPNLGGKNPFRYKGPEPRFPYPEDSRTFFNRRMTEWKTVLGRIFKDPVAGLGGRDAYDVFFNYYMLVGGMGNLPEEDRFEVADLMTDDEMALMWEVDNYERFREYLRYKVSCSSIVDDIIAKADKRLSEKSRGADLRFGHDHVVMALLMIMNIDDFGYIPPSADDLAKTFQTFRSPKAANIQFVFYTPKGKKKGETLVKVLLNGEEVRLGDCPAASGPYYKWENAKAYLASRVDSIVTR